MSLKKILVPLDGSKTSDRILDQVRRILLRKDVELRLLRVLPEPLSYQEDPDRRKRLVEAQSHLERHCEALEAQGARAGYATVPAGDPASRILNYAGRYKPSLIAMTTHGRTGTRRWIRGSVAERILRSAPFPVLLWNPSRAAEGGVKGEGPRFRKILVPLDGSETSARILPLVGELAEAYGSTVVLYHVVPLYANVAGEYPIVQLPPTPAEIARQLAPYRRRLKGIPVKVASELGVPAASILDAAKAMHADLIAMTTHGRSGASRWAFGSVAEQILRHCPYPLLVLRTGGEAVVI